MTIKAVILDLDGTLASFNIDSKAVRAEVRNFLMKVGLPASLLSLNVSIFEMLKETEIFLKNKGKREKSMKEVREKVLGIAEAFEMEAAKTTSLLPGALEALSEIKSMKLKIGLCTINSEKSTQYILNRFKMADYFDAVIARNKVKYVKPSPEHLEAVLNELEVSPEEAIVVGDGTVDMKCARELNVLAVGLSTGVSSENELKRSGANYIITSMADLPALVQSVTEES